VIMTILFNQPHPYQSRGGLQPLDLHPHEQISYNEKKSRKEVDMNTISEPDESLRSLHYDSYIHDYYPLALPLKVDEEMLDFMKHALSEGMNGNAVIYEFFNFYLKRMETGGKTAEKTKLQIADLVKKAGVNGVTLTLGNASKPLDDYESILDSISWWERFIKAADFLEMRTSVEGLMESFRSGKTALIFALQDAGCLGEDLNRLQTLYEKGVRIAQLTYNGQNRIGAGCAASPEAGLTDFGERAVREMNRLCMVVDVSHCNYRTTMDAIAVSGRPSIISHSSCKSVFDHPRAKSDEELKKLAAADGYFGLYAVPFFLSDKRNPDFQIFIHHLRHAVDLLGPERVGIGSDWGLWSPDVPEELLEAAKEAARKMGFGKNMNLMIGTSLKGMADYTDWIRITEALVKAGFSEPQIRGFLGGNFLRFLERAGLR